jgi:hypothetical protein
LRADISKNVIGQSKELILHGTLIAVKLVLATNSFDGYSAVLLQWRSEATHPIPQVAGYLVLQSSA